MPEIYKERIIKHLKHSDYTPQKLAQLARTLGVSSEDYPQFKLAFEELRRAGLAQEFWMEGEKTKTFTWAEGQRFDAALGALLLAP